MIRAEWEQRSTVMVLGRDAWGGAKASGLGGDVLVGGSGTRRLSEPAGN